MNASLTEGTRFHHFRQSETRWVTIADTALSRTRPWGVLVGSYLTL